MSIIIGIDVGGSTTKIVGFEGNRLLEPFLVKANDPLASLYGAFGRFTAINNIPLSEIGRIYVTGAGSSFVDKSIYGLPTEKVEEFDATGRGGLYLSGLDEAIVVSMGTGTALVYAKRGMIYEHLGGTGVGGGTLIGLCKRLMSLSDADAISDLAKDGDLCNVDLLIKDISCGNIPTLEANATASNFGALSELATNADIALGVLNMIFETAGVLAVFGARLKKLEKIVLTGNISVIPQARERFDILEKMFGVQFIIPDNSAYATVIGAALAAKDTDK